MAIVQKHILDLLKEIVNSMTTPPNFYFSKWLGAANNLSQYSLSQLTESQKYPLIFVLLDITENRFQNNINHTVFPNLNIYFINKTQKEKNDVWRLENNFKPILIPLYDEFIEKLKLTYEYRVVNQTNELEHQYIERYFVDNSGANPINQPIDAIELNISNLALRINSFCKK